MITFGIYFIVKLGFLQLYPAYITYKAIKVNNQQEFGSLLTFWVISIAYLSIEYFSDIFLFWFPFYSEIKLVFVLWLILPQTQGASVFYSQYLDPFLSTHEEHIDNTLIEIQTKLKKTLILYLKQAKIALQKVVSDTLFNGNSKDRQETMTAEQNNAQQTEQEPSPLSAAAAAAYSINPYNLFSTLITSTTSRFSQQGTDTATEKLSKTTAASTTPSPISITPTQDSSTELDRNDSHDSLQSYVTVKPSTTNGEDTNNTIDSQQTRPSWGVYLSGYIWKSQSKIDQTSVVPTDTDTIMAETEASHKKQD